MRPLILMIMIVTIIIIIIITTYGATLPKLSRTKMSGLQDTKAHWTSQHNIRFVIRKTMRQNDPYNRMSSEIKTKLCLAAEDAFL